MDNRTVQRDIADLNDYFFMKGGDQRVEYVQSLKAYKLHRTGEGAFTDYDITRSARFCWNPGLSRRTKWTDF